MNFPLPLPTNFKLLLHSLSALRELLSQISSGAFTLCAVVFYIKQQERTLRQPKGNSVGLLAYTRGSLPYAGTSHSSCCGAIYVDHL